MEPIGIRQNNPGNIRYGAGFDGEAAGERGFGRYPDAASGGRALLKNLSTYHRKHGLDTVSGVIGRWAPLNENDTAAYINAVSAELGVTPDDKLDMQDPGTLAKLGTAIAKQEGNGRVFNAEFFNKLVGQDQKAAVFAATQGLPAFSKQQARIAAYRANPDAYGGSKLAVDDTSLIDPIWDAPGDVEYAAAAQGAAEVAQTTRWAGPGETFVESWKQNVTGRVIDMFKRGEKDPNFKIGDEQFEQIGKAGLIPFEDLANFVSGADNQEDFDRRMEIAIERKDYYERAANTQGLTSWGNVAMGFAAGMADPIAIVASAGAGAAVAAARGAGAATVARNAAKAAGENAVVADARGVVAAATANRTGLIRRAAGAGAAENIAAEEFIRRADNQDVSWGDMAAQAIFGAGMGALGGVLAVRSARRAQGQAEIVLDTMLDATAHSTQVALQRRLDNAWAQPPEHAFGQASVLSTDIADLPVYRALSATDTPNLQIERTPVARAIDELMGSPREPIFSALDVEEISANAASHVALQAHLARSPEREKARIWQEVRALRNADKLNYKQTQALAKAELANYERVWQARREELEAAIRGPAPQVRVSGDRPLPPSERTAPRQAGASSVGEGRIPQVRRTYSGEGNQVARFSKGETGKGDFTPITHPRYQAFRKQGLIEEVRAAELEGLPADAKAVYVPKDGKVYVIRERLTAAEAADPTGLIAHEIGVHYGLERTLGTEKYTSVIDEVDRLSRTDARVREALNAVPKDTPAHLVLEEALGYFVEKNTDLGPIARVLAGIRSWLREHIPLFKNLGMTSDELIRMVQGSVEAARKPEVRAAEGPPRFSKTADGQSTSDAARVQIRKAKVEQDITDRAHGWDETIDPEGQRQQAWLRKYYDEVRAIARTDKLQPWLDSPGLITARSKSKVARYLGAHLFESATGMGKRESSVAIQYEQLQSGYKHQALPELKKLLIQGMTTEERVQHMFGGARKAEQRVWRAVAEEGQKHRMALQTGTKYESTAPDYIQKAAKVMDDFYDKVTLDGKLAGNPMAEKVRGAGFVGHIPYEWRWDEISRTYREDPARFKSFYDNLTQQYIERVVDPALDKLADAGPVSPEHASELRTRMMEKVAHQVDNKIRTIMQDPQSRIDGMEQRFETIAADLLDENFAGTKVTPEVIKTFKGQLGDIIRDRSRTELDLVREVNGVALLDFIDYNALSQVTRQSHRWAGLNALARKGFVDPKDAASAKMAAELGGATDEDLAAIDFGFRAFGLGQLKNHERAAFNTMRNFTFATMMGKLGLSILADMPNMITAVGLRGFVDALGVGMGKNTALMEQFAKDAPGLLGQDYRLMSLTPDVSATGRIMVGDGSTLNRISQRAGQAVSYISGANHVQQFLHKGFVPVVTEGVLRTIRGEDGGITPARMVDMGLDKATMSRIKSQLDKYDAGRERGDRINWDQWDDQEAADRLRDGLHRATYQVFQRGMVGEQPMWMTESIVGTLVGQFRRYGIVAAEKQVARGLAIGDVNTATSFALGVTWATALYYARLQMNTAGMGDEEKREYIERNTQGFRMATGILNLMNASGFASEFVQIAETFLGGDTYQQRGSAIASLGWAANLMRAGNQFGSWVTGQSEDSKQLTRSLFRIAPGGNTILGSYLMNTLSRE